MCNDYGNNIPYSAYLEAFSETRIPVRFPAAAPNLEARADIWPTDTAPVIRQVEDGLEFAQLRWGFPPARPKAAPVINFRSEGRRFPKGRCLVPASHFFEFTGSKSPKSKWKFSRPGEDWLDGTASPRAGVAKSADDWMYPFEPAGARSPVGPSTKGDHHVATACADD
jgi:putative SOS response-associated peptidase YedK